MYHGARMSRLTSGFGVANSSADAELSTSLTNLRTRSRQLLRDSPYARRAKNLVVNNVIGPGVGMQAKVQSEGTLAKTINNSIEEGWEEWAQAKNCHTGGELCFPDLERQGMDQVFAAGEVCMRMHLRKFGASKVPLAIELIEAERMADELSQVGAAQRGNQIRIGVEVDEFFRPQAFYFRRAHPGDILYNGLVGGSDAFERVPSEAIFHLRVITRWPQTRGEPWLCATGRKLNDMDGYSEAEIIAARAAANLIFTKKSAPGSNPLKPMGERRDDGGDEFTVEPGMGYKLLEGEELNMHNPARPNTALDPFMRYMLREMAAGLDVPYDALSQDYSQTNYSSSRLAILDARDAWRTMQWWWIRSFRYPLHLLWLRQAVLSRAIPKISLESYMLNPARFERVAFKPRGWDWVDPSKDVASFKEAIKGGLTTRTQIIAQTGNGLDREELDDERAEELKYSQAVGLTYDTDPASYAAKKGPPAPSPTAEDASTAEETDDPQSRVVSFRR